MVERGGLNISEERTVEISTGQFVFIVNLIHSKADILLESWHFTVKIVSGSVFSRKIWPKNPDKKLSKIDQNWSGFRILTNPDIWMSAFEHETPDIKSRCKKIVKNS